MIGRMRVARLGTVDIYNQPYVIPVVFVFDGAYFFIPLDSKRKTVSPGDLRRFTDDRGAKRRSLDREHGRRNWIWSLPRGERTGPGANLSVR